MNFYTILENNIIKKLESLTVGDRILCEDGNYYPVKNILVISDYPTFCRFSNGLNFYIPKRMLLKTTKGFKHPELWDIIEINKELTPQIISLKNIDRIKFFYDILIDGNIVTPEGIIFKYQS